MIFSGKREFDRRNLGAAPPGSKIIWHDDPSGAAEIPVVHRPKNDKE